MSNCQEQGGHNLADLDPQRKLGLLLLNKYICRDCGALFNADHAASDFGGRPLNREEILLLIGELIDMAIEDTLKELLKGVRKTWKV